MAEQKKKPCILFSGGGTSGHIYPALAIAKALNQAHPDVEILFCGTAKGLEAELVPKHGFSFAAIEAQPFSFRPGPAMWRSWKTFKRGQKQCSELLSQRRVVAVVGTGGYVCAPLMAAAAKQNIPVYLHEQNAYPGRSNRLMARHATVVFLGCEAARPYFKRAQNVIFTGNPVREAFFSLTGKEGQLRARQALELPIAVKLILLSGGSLGARKINTSVLDFLQEQTLPPDVHLILATGKRLFEETRQECTARRIQLNDQVQILPYLENMDLYMAAADLVIGRAGASTCAELGVLRKPSVLIPYPFAAGNHQLINARVLVDEGAAQLVLDEDWDASCLKNCVDELLLKPEQLAKMQNAASGFAKKNTLDLILQALSRAIPQD